MYSPTNVLMTSKSPHIRVHNEFRCSHSHRNPNLDRECEEEGVQFMQSTSTGHTGHGNMVLFGRCAEHPWKFLNIQGIEVHEITRDEAVVISIHLA